MAKPSAIDLAAFYINLDRSPDRREVMEATFAHLPWPLTRIPAHDARRDPGEVLNVRGLAIGMDPYIGWDPYRYRAYSLAEEGCFASHMTTLQAFLASGHAYGLILEDDAIPAPDLVAVLDSILAAPPSFDILKLEGSRHSGSRLAFEERRVGRVSVVRSFRPSACSAGYVVTRSGAQKLLDHAGTLPTVYDYYLTNPGLNHAHILHVSPWLIRQAQFETLIPVSGKNTRTSRNPVHSLLESGRRLGMRFALWGDVMKGGMKPLIRAPWGEP